MTYTQILSLPSGDDIIPDKHGINRDNVKVSIIHGKIGIIAVADGCGLQFWSQIASHVAVNEFVSYIGEKILEVRKVEQIPSLIIDAILYTNSQLSNYYDPKRKETINILEMGGNTTIAVSLVFPYSVNSNGEKEINLMNNGNSCSWGSFCLGMGDSEMYCFRAQSHILSKNNLEKEENNDIDEPENESSSNVQNEPEEESHTDDTLLLQDQSSVSLSDSNLTNSGSYITNISHTNSSLTNADSTVIISEQNNDTDNSTLINEDGPHIEKPTPVHLKKLSSSAEYFSVSEYSSSEMNHNSEDIPNFNFETKSNLYFGKWECIFKDTPKTHFLPFLGLKASHIPTPIFVPLYDGDTIIAVSDGVSSSFPNNNINFPSIDKAKYQSNDGLYSLCYNIIKTAHENHILNNTDPDDVTIGALKICRLIVKKKIEKIKAVDVKDLTKEFHGEDKTKFYKKNER